MQSQNRTPNPQCYGFAVGNLHILIALDPKTYDFVGLWPKGFIEFSGNLKTIEVQVSLVCALLSVKLGEGAHAAFVFWRSFVADARASTCYFKRPSVNKEMF